MTDNLQERNEQTLNDIKSLQTTEMKLYDSLENKNLSYEQKQQIINQINQISQMRINLYANLKSMFSNYQQNVSTSRNTLNDQMTTVSVIEDELDDEKRRLNLLETEKNNKIRLVEINTYYSKQYDANKEIMKTVVYICIPILILTILANKEIIPQIIYVILSGVIIIIGLILIGYQIIDLSNRDNMNFDEYNWAFDKSNIDSTSASTSNVSGNNDPWAPISLTCVGSECCIDGSKFDSTLNKCIF